MYFQKLKIKEQMESTRTRQYRTAIRRHENNRKASKFGTSGITLIYNELYSII